MDASAWLGNSEAPGVGIGGFAEVQNSNGSLLVALCECSGLALPSTWEDPGQENFTWTSPVGTKHQLDFIAVPAD
eukprot:12933246-Prorocentrum_lima.AAC.1